MCGESAIDQLTNAVFARCLKHRKLQARNKRAKRRRDWKEGKRRKGLHPAKRAALTRMIAKNIGPYVIARKLKIAPSTVYRRAISLIVRKSIPPVSNGALIDPAAPNTAISVKGKTPAST